MKTNICASALVSFLLLGILPVKSAVVVSNLTTAEYNQQLSTSTVSWKVEMIAGFPSTSTREITVTANNVQHVHHLWGYPEQIVIGYDASGNLNVRAGSTVLTAQPLTGFNAVMVQVTDTTQFFSTELRSNTFNGTSFRNLFADDNDTFIPTSDQVKFGGVGSTFSLQSVFYQNSYDRGAVITFTGVSSVPEPTWTIHFLATMVFLFLRRR